jgi:hypothetical protein
VEEGDIPPPPPLEGNALTKPDESASLPENTTAPQVSGKQRRTSIAPWEVGSGTSLTSARRDYRTAEAGEEEAVVVSLAATKEVSSSLVRASIGGGAPKRSVKAERRRRSRVLSFLAARKDSNDNAHERQLNEARLAALSQRWDAVHDMSGALDTILAGGKHHEGALMNLWQELKEVGDEVNGLEEHVQATHKPMLKKMWGKVRSLAKATGRIKAVGQPLHVMPVLELGGNGIGDEGVAWIAYLIQHNPHVTALNLARNDISDIGALALAKAIANADCALRELDVSSNKLTEVGIGNILQAAEKNVTLECLSLGDNAVGATALNWLASSSQGFYVDDLELVMGDPEEVDGFGTEQPNHQLYPSTVPYTGGYSFKTTSTAYDVDIL